MGRRKTTGRFETREELERRVLQFYHTNNLSMASIATNCGISPSTASKIIDDNPGWQKSEFTDERLEVRVQQLRSQGKDQRYINGYVRGWEMVK